MNSQENHFENILELCDNDAMKKSLRYIGEKYEEGEDEEDLQYLLWEEIYTSGAFPAEEFFQFLVKKEGWVREEDNTDTSDDEYQEFVDNELSHNS